MENNVLVDFQPSVDKFTSPGVRCAPSSLSSFFLFFFSLFANWIAKMRISFFFSLYDFIGVFVNFIISVPPCRCVLRLVVQCSKLLSRYTCFYAPAQQPRVLRLFVFASHVTKKEGFVGALLRHVLSCATHRAFPPPPLPPWALTPPNNPLTCVPVVFWYKLLGTFVWLLR